MKNSHKPGSICILKLSAIGDVCHAIAAVQMIQKHWPNQPIVWVVGKEAFELISELKGIEFIVIDKKDSYRYSIKHLRSQLKGRTFDYLLHMQTTVRANILSLCIKATIRFGYDPIRSRVFQRFFVNHTIDPPLKDHAIDAQLDFVKALGIPISKPVWNIPINKASDRFLSELLPTNNRPLFVIHPCASQPEKNWPSSHYAELAHYATKKGFDVVLTGNATPHENAIAQEISAQSCCPTINLLGKLDLKMLVALLARAQLVLAPDTGPLHIAVATGTPVIGLYGRTNPKRTGPYPLTPDNVISVYEEAIAEQYEIAISDLPWRTHAQGHHVMQRISVPEVKSKFDQWARTILLSYNNTHEEAV